MANYDPFDIEERHTTSSRQVHHHSYSAPRRLVHVGQLRCLSGGRACSYVKPGMPGTDLQMAAPLACWWGQRRCSRRRDLSGIAWGPKREYGRWPAQARAKTATDSALTLAICQWKTGSPRPCVNTTSKYEPRGSGASHLASRAMKWQRHSSHAGMRQVA